MKKNGMVKKTLILLKIILSINLVISCSTNHTPNERTTYSVKFSENFEYGIYKVVSELYNSYSNSYVPEIIELYDLTLLYLYEDYQRVSKKYIEKEVSIEELEAFVLLIEKIKKDFKIYKEQKTPWDKERVNSELKKIKSLIETI